MQQLYYVELCDSDYLKSELFAQACILRKQNFKIMHATKNIIIIQCIDYVYSFLGHFSKEKDTNRLKIIYHLICLAHEELTNLSFISICSPNGMHVTCICLRCGGHKQYQNCLHIHN